MTTRLLTNVLETAGILLIVAALAVAVGSLWLPGGLFVAGAGLLAASWAITKMQGGPQ